MLSEVFKVVEDEPQSGHFISAVQIGDNEPKKERVKAYEFPENMPYLAAERRLAEELFADGNLVAAFRFGHKGMAGFALNRELIESVDRLEIKHVARHLGEEH